MNSFGYFGKLPGHPDFVRFNSSGLEITQIDRWIQEGLYAARLKYDDWKEKYKKQLPYNFIIPFENNKAVTGSLFFSRDKSGREFPFIIHYSTERSCLPESQFLMPVYLRENFNFIEGNFINDVDEKLSLPVNEKKPDIPGFQIDNNYQLFLRRKQTEFWGTIFGNHSNPGKYEFIKKLTAEDQRSNYVLEFPLHADETEKEYCIAFIIHLLLRTKHKTNIRTTIFWNESAGEKNKLFIFINGLKNLGFLSLIEPGSPDTEIIYLDENTADNGEFFPYRQMLDDKDLTLRDLINNL